MHVLVTVKIKVDEEQTERVSELLEEIGEVFFDDDANSLNLSIDDNWLDNPKDTLNEILFSPICNEVGTAKFEGKIVDQDSDRTKNFECECTEETIRYRETDFYFSGDMNDMTYEEIEESGYNELSEDDYNEYSQRDDADKDVLFNEFNDWECIETNQT